MSQPSAKAPVFNYVASIQAREFIVTLTQDMMSQWEDLHGRTLEDQLQGETEDSMYRVPITDKIFAKAMEMVQREQLEESQTGTFQEPTGETANDIAEMDQLFAEFFWQEVNHLLKKPLIDPTQQTRQRL